MPAEITQRVNAGGGSSGSASPAATRVAVKAANKQPNPKSAFFTQTIPAWTPILTPFWIYVILGSTGVAFIAIGIALKLASDGVVELRRQYDGAGAEAPACAAPLQGGAPTRCTLSFTVPAAMKAPVFVYYELTNFYQNHRRYVQSRSNEQLAGALLPAASLTSACSPLVSAPNGKTLHPCGLIANSLFNDTFCPAGTCCKPASSTTPCGAAGSNPLGWKETDIAWPSDRDSLFKPIAKANYAAQSGAVQFLNDTYPKLYCGVDAMGDPLPCDIANPLDVDNEHFIVWMRPAALPEFRKLYGRFTSDIPAGTVLTFNVQSAFPVAPFAGTKALVVSTLSWAGGRNPFLGVAYLVVGSLSIALAAGFWVRQNVCGGRALGDAQSLQWEGGSSRR